MNPVKALVAIWRYIALRNFGYGQDDRLSALARNGKLGVAGLREPGDTDCSMLSGIGYYLAGLIPLELLLATFYSGNIASVLAKTGMFELIDVRSWSLARIRGAVRRGDSLVGPGHVTQGLGHGRVVSAERTEKGGSTGGKAGDQDGGEIRTRTIYLRSSSSRIAGKSKTGWVAIIRLKALFTLLGEAVAAHGTATGVDAALDRLSRRSPKRASRYADFFAEWDALDQGATVTYDSAALQVPQTGHAYVILGSVAADMANRCAAALPGILANPNSIVVVSGAPVRQGKTEAAWMRDWLVANGVAAKRIVLDEKAASTIGNAVNAVRILWNRGRVVASRRITSYTLVSDESHLRRAGILFRAALARKRDEKRDDRTLTATVAVAHNDYGEERHNSVLPIDDATRLQYAGWVAYVLGVSEQYKQRALRRPR